MIGIFQMGPPKFSLPKKMGENKWGCGASKSKDFFALFPSTWFSFFLFVINMDIIINTYKLYFLSF